MATITSYKRKYCVAWRMQIRRKGVPFFSKFFESKEKAEEWALANEEKYIANPTEYIKYRYSLKDRRKLEFIRKRKANERRTKGE